MNGLNNELAVIVKSIKYYMELERESGTEEFIVPAGRKADLKSKDVPDPPSVKAAGEISPSEAKADGLGALKREVLGCTRCDLCNTRRNVVFGSGSPTARLMFIGEAPGEEEDVQGLPFVGRAGQLLTKMIEAMGFKRQDVYIANILKCRPPNNRSPLPTEILACADNIRRQVELIKPEAICTLGKFASQTLLKTERPISALRGQFSEYNGIKVMPTFHPAYLLRNPGDKRLVWHDMKKVMKELHRV